MNYTEAMEYMEAAQANGIVLGMENIRNLCEKLGNPQDKLKFVHIAGTNGKGSVLAFLSTVLQTAGYTVGRYVSPTIFEYRERIQVNGRMIPKNAFCRHTERIRDAVVALQEEGKPCPTPFELETAMAFSYFLEKNCDIVILETGLGGALDATNIIRTAALCVFTSVSRDHMAFLGDSLEEIARQKAGILKPGCPAVTASQSPEVMGALTEAAAQKGCTLWIGDGRAAKRVRYGIEKQKFSYQGWNDIEITLAGRHQIENAVVALEAVSRLAAAGFPVSENQLRKGMKDTVWPGRFSVITKKPYFIADGAHNEDAAAKLAESVRFYFTNKKIVYIMGILRDKEYDKIIRITVPYAQQVITVTPPGNKRAMSAYELAAEVKKYHGSVTAADSLQEAVEMSYLLADKDSVIIAFGSLSFLGEMIHIVENRHTIGRDSHGRS